MTFEDFARMHGLILSQVLQGKWITTPTEDHPKSSNGRYKFLGEVGWVQNWATMTAPRMWRGSTSVSVHHVFQRDDRERVEAAKKAAGKAAWILKQCQVQTHPYLEKKGFPDEVGNVWTINGDRLLVVPMRRNFRLVGVQLIDDEGNKKFLQGQSTKGAAFVMNANGLPFFVEGYATGLSVRAALKALKVRYCIYVCFSARNLQEVAREIEGGVVVADCDLNKVGELAARASNKPYWMSDTVGEDFNDFHNRVGLFKATVSLRRAIYGVSSATE
jgi:putative DNA primase/helicase